MTSSRKTRHPSPLATHSIHLCHNNSAPLFIDHESLKVADNSFLYGDVRHVAGSIRRSPTRSLWNHDIPISPAVHGRRPGLGQ